MKEYPSIPASTGNSFVEFDAYVFDKVDGSNLRFEWGRKQGWYKFGTRHRLFDQTDPVFGSAISLFNTKLSAPLTEIAKKERWDQLIVFAEFWGPKSFAGNHEAGDDMHLTLFDANPHKKGILGPKEFLKLFADKVETAPFLGQYKWTRGFVERVWRGEIEGITLEGVVGKGGEGHKLRMAKTKTKTWIDKVKARYAPAEAEKIINS